jgi:hypothetical protein
MKKPNLSNKSLNKSIYFNLKLFVQSQNQFPHKTKKNWQVWKSLTGIIEKLDILRR